MNRNIFGKIKEINVQDKDSWSNRLFLTFDMEWAIDPVLENILDIIEKFNLHVTIFVTHDTSLLTRMRNNKNIELGIHPNFNYLLDGDFRYGRNYIEVIDYYKKIVPDAVSVRSHSMTQNTPILKEFTRHGIKFDCNSFFPFNGKELHLHPFLFWDNKLVRVPHFWEDDVNFHSYENRFSYREVLSYKGLKVFDFHPMHIYLNTYTLGHYNSARPFFKRINKLESFVNTKEYGVRDFLIDLLSDIMIQ